MSERGSTDDITNDIIIRVWRAIKGAPKDEPLYGVAVHPEDLMHLTFFKKDVDGWEDMSTFVTHIHDLRCVSDTAVEPGELLFLTEEEWRWNVEAGHIVEAG